MRVRLSRDAAEDVRGIRSYVTTHADAVIAERVVARIGAALASAALFPAIGHHGHVPATFELLVPRLPFVIVHRIDYGDSEAELVVLRVCHASRQRA